MFSNIKKYYFPYEYRTYEYMYVRGIGLSASYQFYHFVGRIRNVEISTFSKNDVFSKGKKVFEVTLKTT